MKSEYILVEYGADEIEAEYRQMAIRNKCIKVAWCLCLITLEALAQEAPKRQSWLAPSTKLELSLAGGAIAADAWTTRKYVNLTSQGNGFIVRTREDNPLARPFVKSDLGAGAYFGAGYAGLVTANYFLRRHDRVRHVVNWTVIAGEAYWAVHNSQIRTSPPSVIKAMAY